MAEVIKGTGVRWGVGGVTFTAGIVSGTNAMHMQNFDFDRTTDKAELKDANGEVIGVVFYNGKRILRITVVPTGASITAANSSVDAYMIAPGTKITIADSEGASIDGDYNLISSKMRGSNADFTMVDLELEDFDANDVTATIS